MIVAPLHEPLIRAVAEDLRPRDRTEIIATVGHADPGVIARHLATLPAVIGGVACDDDGQPIAVMHLAWARPGVVGASMFATPRFRRIARPLTAWARDTAIPGALAQGAHRIEAHSMASHAAAHRWMRALGARPEGVHPGWGTAGETFLTFAWVAPHVPVFVAEHTEAPGAGGTATAAQPQR